MVTYVTPLFELAKAGFAWFSIDYRLTPQYRHQDQIQDLREAIRFVRAHENLPHRPDRIAVIGESASGQMAALLATRVSKRSSAQGRRRIPSKSFRERSERGFAAAVSLYGVYDFEAMTGELTPRSIPSRLFGITVLTMKRARAAALLSIASCAGEHDSLLLVSGRRTVSSLNTTLLRTNSTRPAPTSTPSRSRRAARDENWEGRPEWMDYKTKLVEWLKAKLAPRK